MKIEVSHLTISIGEKAEKIFLFPDGKGPIFDGNTLVFRDDSNGVWEHIQRHSRVTTGTKRMRNTGPHEDGPAVG